MFARRRLVQPDVMPPRERTTRNARERTDAGTTRQSGAEFPRTAILRALPTDAPPVESTFGSKRESEHRSDELAGRSSHMLVRFFARCLDEIKTPT
jgi:hypothetical protein